MSEKSACPSPATLANLLRQNLTADERAVVHQHVASCQACQSALDDLTQLPEDVARLRNDGLSHAATRPGLTELIGRLQSREPAEFKELHGTEFVDDLVGQRLAGYQVVRRIAQGGGGTLYQAFDPALNRDVAIKRLHASDVVDEESARRLASEARAVAAIDHPNVVRLFGLSSDKDERPFLVMEYVDGETLADRLQRDEVLPPNTAATIVRDLAHALSAAHARSLVHRDVKPSNVLLKGDQTKLTDFGLVLDEERQTRMTREGMIAGTPNYMSPEQIQNPHYVDHRSDVYSLGTVLYELLTGQTPFRGVQRMTLMQILHDEPRPPRQLNDAIPGDLETICLKAMAKEPARRYGTAMDFANDLENWIAGRAITARPVGRVERIVRWCRRNSRIALLLASTCLLLALLAVGGTVAALRMRTLKSLADQQRDIALDTLQSMVFDVYDRLDEEDDPAIYIAQRELVRSAILGLQRLPTSPAVSVESEWTQLAAMARLGSIEYRLGNEDVARNELVKVLRLCGDLDFSYESLGHVGYRRVRPLSHAHFFLGLLALEDGLLDEAMTHLQTSLNLDEHLVATMPRRIDFQLEAVSSLAALVDVTFERGEAKRCLEYAARCESMVEQLEANDNASEYDVARSYLPSVLYCWGKTLGQQGDVKRARQRLEQGMELLDDDYFDGEQLSVRTQLVAALIELERREGNTERAAKLASDLERRFDEFAELAEELEDDDLRDWVEMQRAVLRASTQP